MKNSQFNRYLHAFFKCSLHHMPSVLLYAIIFILSSSAVIYYCGRLSVRDDSIKRVNIGYFIDDSTRDTEFALNIVLGMDGFRESSNLIEYSTEESGLKALDDDLITCLIVVPDGLINSLLNGVSSENTLRVVFKDNKTIEQHMVNDLLQSSASILGTAQAAYFTLHRVNSEFPIASENAVSIERNLDTTNLTYVLARNEFFTRESFDVLYKYTFVEQLSASYILLILFLSVFVVAYIYKGNSSAFKMQYKAAGLNTLALYTAETLIITFILYIIYLLCFAAVAIAGLGASCISLILVIPALLIISAFITLISYIVKNPVAAGLVTLVTVIIFMYLAGGLIPMEFLPYFIQKTGIYSPFRYLIKYMQFILWR